MSNKIRALFIIVVAIATAFTVGKSIVRPAVKSSSVNNYTFPESIALSKWNLSASKPVKPNLVKPPAYISGNFIAGKHYQYVRNGKLLNIEMRYLADTNGDLKSFITNQTGELSSGLKQDENRGFYSLYTHKDKAYLSACINPRGNTTITSDQFKRNLMIHDNRIERIFPWLTGQAEFRDKRCLWAHLSVPLNKDIVVDENYETLETAWHDWYDYWRSHYPEA